MHFSPRAFQLSHAREPLMFGCCRLLVQNSASPTHRRRSLDRARRTTTRTGDRALFGVAWRGRITAARTRSTATAGLASGAGDPDARPVRERAERAPRAKTVLKGFP